MDTIFSSTQPSRYSKRSLRLLGTSLTTVALLLAHQSTQPARAGTITVNGSDPVLHCTLADAITTANTGADTGHCSGGDAAGPDTILLNANITLNAPTPSIISEITIQGNGYTIDGNGYQVFYVDGYDSYNGALTLENAQITGGSAAYSGGVIYNHYGSVTVNNCVLSGNDAASAGGAIYNYYGTLTVNDSTISGNEAMFGGGIYNFQGAVTLNRSVITGNTVSHRGGGIVQYGGTLEINASDITLNGPAPYGAGYYVIQGGGIYIIGAPAGPGAYEGAVIVKNASTISENSAFDGGGIFSYQGTVTIEASEISQNTADNNGGGIRIINGALTVQSNSVISNNAATYLGGGIDAYNCPLDVIDSAISGNSGESGGGIFADYVTLEVTGSTISGNTVTNKGGGIYVYQYGSAAIVQGSTISDNDALNGGGIYNDRYSSLTVIDSTISENTATNSGGGIFNYDYGVLNVNTSTISGNTAAYFGGGIHNSNHATLNINTSTISANTSTNGGGMFNIRGTVDINHSTISGNSAALGGGISSTYGAVNVYASIVARQTAGDDCYDYMAYALNPTGYNIESGIICGFDIHSVSDAALGLGALADNGGPTQTMALGAGSVALDRFTPAGAGADQRGVTRGLDGNGDGATAWDVGAFELGDLVCAITAPPDMLVNFAGGVKMNVTAAGADLGCLRVTPFEGSHPLATSGPTGGIDTGMWWKLEALKSDKATAATPGWLLDLTLPFPGADADNDRLCRYTGTGPYGWVCDKTSVGTNEITLNGVGEFSDWAVGNHVGPNQVRLRSLLAHASGGWLESLRAWLLGWLKR